MIVRKVVGVCPPPEWAKRARLFEALEAAFPARFEARRPGELRGLDALIAIGDESASGAAGLRRLVLRENRSALAPGIVRLSTSPLLDHRLRGWKLEEGTAHGAETDVGVADPGCVVASCRRTALWVRTEEPNGIDRAALAPDELDGDESLRDAFVPRRWLGLLPLVHFLREVCAELSWTPPPLRAAFLVDDPNLHWPSYGHLVFGELVRHAEEHGYHVGIATIPLDGWFVHPRVAGLVRARSDVLSLIAHGNDHLRGEFTQSRSQWDALRMLAQASRRLSALERKAGVEIAMLAVAPFGVCSPEMMRALLLAGYEGLFYAWSVPRVPDGLLAGWEIADLTQGGFPIFPRVLISNPRDQLVLRSYLDQPLLLYGHHSDFADGLDVLAEATVDVGRAGRVQWSSPARIARSSFLRRREGSTLRVRPYARIVQLDLPVGVESVIVELPSSHGEPDRETVVCSADTAAAEARSRFTRGVSDAFDTLGRRRLEIRLTRDDAVDLAAIPSPPRRLRPYVRRFATESRDRVAPLVMKLRV